jgi:dynein heavy chain
VAANSQEEFLSYIRELPLNPNPEVFGLHENAEITTKQSETIRILESIISI